MANMTLPAEASPESKPFLSATVRELESMSRSRGWSLSALELSAIQTHFKSLRREPRPAEIETIAQTWSEHCKHKTFTSPIRYTEDGKTQRFSNLLRETIMEATRRLNKPWCLSVFKDNAGIVRFDDHWAVAFKVETHNHPCALEPYGGATTGVGGVIRDILGAGLGARPILNTDVFCLGTPDRLEPPPEGMLHPRRTFAGVVAGVRDYGNRMGIPTAAGALWFDDDYRFNPLVFCGTMGLIPSWAIRKEVKPGDLIVAAGGRTGRDGLHGATFSSAAIDDTSSSSAVQIGDAIVEKRLLDALLAARDRRLYRAVTDCGAGGFSSAVGELGASCGARVCLDKAPLKVSDLQPWEIWLSESQERMVLAVPPKNRKALEAVFEAEGAETAVIGEFTDTGRLEVFHRSEKIVDLDMGFLHDGLPRVERVAAWSAPKASNGRKRPCASPEKTRAALHAALSHLNVCSRAWVIRQYDHEVLGGTVIKPLQGTEHDGPGDACVIWPQALTGNLQNHRGIAVSHGLNPAYGRIDPYAMALACADEALRNLTSVGADISQAAFLDNFCWGSPQDPAVLGGLVRAAMGCRDAALGFEAPFISGKDSLFNEYRPGKNGSSSNGRAVPIPGTLLITALAPVPDIRKAVTMDFKAPGHRIYLVGRTAEELGGSVYAQWAGLSGGRVPGVDPRSSRKTLRALGQAISQGLVASCHDLSDGGLAVALAEMAFAGEVGACIDLDTVARARDVSDEDVILFSESQSRLLVEVRPEKERAFLQAMKDAVVSHIGNTIANPVIKIVGMDGCSYLEEPLDKLKASWERTLPSVMNGR